MIFPFTAASPRIGWRFVQTTMTRVGSTDDFYQSVAGVAGLTVAVSMYDADGNLLDSGPATQADPVNLPGVYYYEPDTSLMSVSDYYVFVASSNGTTNVDEPVLTQVVWVSPSGVGILTGNGADLGDTLASLLSMLRIRLNDTDEGNYSQTELMYCLNLAYRETVVLTLCHKGTATIALVTDQHTYDIVDLTDSYLKIFEPVEVMIGPGALVRKNLGDMGVNLERWAAEVTGIPTEYIQLSGNQVMLHPTPSALALGAISTLTATPTAAGSDYHLGDILTITETDASGGTALVKGVSATSVTSVELVTAGCGYTVGTGKETTAVPPGGSGCTVEVASIGKLSVVGYAQPKPLLLPVDRPVALQDAFSVQVILDRAEAEARKCRITTSQNAVLYERLMASWKSWCEKSRETARGKA